MAMMQAYIEKTYGVAGEHLFSSYPGFLVFRHSNNRKWFAVWMELPRQKLGLSGDGMIPVLNVKCDTRMIGSFRETTGIYPGYHMNKDHWLTVALDGSAEEDVVKLLVQMSYDLTKGGRR